MSIQIREAQTRDLVDMLGIYNEIILTTTTIYSYSPRSLAEQISWLGTRQKDGFPVLVAEAEGRILGYTSYGYFRNWPGYDNTREHSIYLHQDARGKGLGRRLLEALIEHARRNSVHVLIASVDSENEASLQFHKRLGFEEVACFKQVGYKFGRWLDLYFLQKILVDRPKPIALEELSITLEPATTKEVFGFLVPLYGESVERDLVRLESQSRAALVVTRLHGKIVACASLQPHSEVAAEVKLFGLNPDKKQVVDGLLGVLEQTARLINYSQINLQTSQPDLATFLKDQGYKPIDCLSQNKAELCFEKSL